MLGCRLSTVVDKVHKGIDTSRALSKTKSGMTLSRSLVGISRLYSGIHKVDIDVGTIYSLN